VNHTEDRQEAGPAGERPTDSASFLRCAACRHAADVNPAAGTLLCRRHNMFVDALANEIPDDCPAFEPSAPAPA